MAPALIVGNAHILNPFRDPHESAALRAGFADVERLGDLENAEAFGAQLLDSLNAVGLVQPRDGWPP
jgi:hypothetical protein